MFDGTKGGGPLGRIFQRNRLLLGGCTTFAETGVFGQMIVALASYFCPLSEVCRYDAHTVFIVPDTKTGLLCTVFGVAGFLFVSG